MKTLALTLALLLALPLVAAPRKKKGQLQPDPARITQIQQALDAHGYPPGKNWNETKEICRKIAYDRGWQNLWAPDARVLVLLGLALNLDPDVANGKPTILDAEQRKWVEQNGVGKIKP